MRGIGFWPHRRTFDHLDFFLPLIEWGRGRNEFANQCGVAMTAVGLPALMPDSRERVSGTITFTGNIEVPGMLHGKLLRSPHPHARILKVDAGRAARLTGVITVMTGQDLIDAPINS